ncbi:MAG: SdrD B-like domain-containing protein [Pirellulaceae bacterium]|nr:SdrD B-like domain-containing protein [Pirellulaceae bacterium]
MPKRKDAISRLFFRFLSRKRPSVTKPRRLNVESLEGRRLLAVTGTSPAITGTVFIDSDNDSNPAPGEGVGNATVQLYLDNGDGSLDVTDTLVEEVTTDPDGVYGFENLDGLEQYFVVQPTQIVDGLLLLEQTSAVISPGESTLVIDQFETPQSVMASSPVPSSNGSTLSFANESEVIGAERDMYVNMTAGIGEVQLRVNPFGMNPVLQYDSTSGVEGSSIVTWDGTDNDSNPTPSMGLGGRDLTQGGVNTGFTMALGIDSSGAGDTVEVKLFQGDASNVSSASAAMPITGGTATGYLFLPFSDFPAPVSADNVDAIQLIIGGDTASADAQVAFIGVTGPRVHDFANLPSTDLSIVKTDGATSAIPGTEITYTITVENRGPMDVAGATVTDNFPATLENISYTSATTGTVSGNTVEGVNDISDTVDMTVGSTIVYTVDATISSAATGTLENTATVQPPEGVIDPDEGNNTSTDSNQLTPAVDLTVNKTDNRTTVAPGEEYSYTISITNEGPSDVVGARFTDAFPATINNVNFTSSVTSGTVTGNTAVGFDDIDDLLNMTADSSLEYITTATVDQSAEGTIDNTADIQVPEGTIDLDPETNSSTDTTDVGRVVDVVVTKTDGQETAAPNQELVYQITVSNLGPSDVSNVEITDDFPTELLNVNYESTAEDGASGNTPSGSDNISDIVSLPAGSRINYTASGVVAESASVDVSNTIVATLPPNVTDPTPETNTATDTTRLLPGVDLVITKTNNLDEVYPGQELTYEIVASNQGPNAVVGAVVEDIFPPELIDVSYTSSASESASGNTEAGEGNINDTLDLGIDASVTYTVVATVASDATGILSNTARITAPAGYTELDPTNTVATDTDPINVLEAAINGFVFLDQNNNGVFDEGEPPIPGAEVLLQDTERVNLESKETDVNGYYEFTSLAADSYYVESVLPEGYRRGKNSPGGEFAERVANDLFFVTIGDSDVASDLDFGLLPIQPSKRELLASSFV